MNSNALGRSKAITSETLAYTDGETRLTGYLAHPGGTPRAAVLVFPTIANPTPAMERRARMLADAGYVAMVADFYGHLPEGMDAIRAAAAELRADVDAYRSRLRSALAALRKHPASRGLPVAAIGFCMGGQAALELARDGADIRAAVSFHGLLDSDRPASAETLISARILVLHGDKDPMVPRTLVTAFQEEMDGAGVDWHLHVYGNARHGFTDPASDARGMAALAYDERADRHSWAAMLTLFDELFES